MARAATTASSAPTATPAAHANARARRANTACMAAPANRSFRRHPARKENCATSAVLALRRRPSPAPVRRIRPETRTDDARRYALRRADRTRSATVTAAASIIPSRRRRHALNHRRGSSRRPGRPAWSSPEAGRLSRSRHHRGAGHPAEKRSRGASAASAILRIFCATTLNTPKLVLAYGHHQACINGKLSKRW